MPTRTLATVAVMCTITPEALQRQRDRPAADPGSLHAAEHAAIGLLPLVASCDRGDIGGVSTAVGPVRRPADDIRLRRLSRRGRIRRTRLPQDRAPGGRRRPRRSKRANARSGCPSCVQSPKCGNGNDPLDKAGAVRVLRLVLASTGGRWAVNRPRMATDPSTVAPARWRSGGSCYEGAQTLNTAGCGERSDNAIRSQSRRAGRSGKIPRRRGRCNFDRVN